MAHSAEAIRAICQAPVAEDDGLRFDPATVAGEPITAAAEYAGGRVRLWAYLGTARIPVQIDIGCGDALVPGPTPTRLPTILDLPPAEVQGYRRCGLVDRTRGAPAQQIRRHPASGGTYHSLGPLAARRLATSVWDCPLLVRQRTDESPGTP